MKSHLINLFCLLILLVSINAFGQMDDGGKLNSLPHASDIVLLDSVINLYHAGDFYISGQPNDSIFSALKNIGLDLVINIRTPQEMELLMKDGFNEKLLLDSLSIPYLNVPIGGSAGYTKEAIDRINSAIQNHPGQIMIHCRSAGRATNAWVAWLINYNDVAVNEAITLGKHMQMRFYLEDLLGYELFFGKK